MIYKPEQFELEETTIWNFKERGKWATHLKKDKHCTVLIGDIRKNKNVIPLGFYIMNIFIEAGFTLKEIIIKEQHNCKKTDYWSKNKIRDFYLLAHEYIFVLKK